MDRKGIRGEIPMVSYADDTGIEKYLLTMKPTRDFFYLYAVSASGSLEKLGRGKTPTELEEKFRIKEKICMTSCKRGAGRIK